jgi:NAD(P)H-flavin reductase
MTTPTESLAILERTRLARHHVLFRLDASAWSGAGEQKAPGHYAMVALSAGADPKPMALASKPGAQTLELVVRVHSDEHLAETLALEGPMKVSAPMGKGFPLDRARGRPLWLFAAGSAIGAIRPVVESIFDDREAFGPVHLLYGARGAADLCFTDRFEAWRAAGIEVTPVVSEPEAWDGATGYVQDQLPETLERAGEAIAFICGMPPMEEAVIQALGSRGLEEDRIFRNWK